MNLKLIPRIHVKKPDHGDTPEANARDAKTGRFPRLTSQLVQPTPQAKSEALST